MKQLAMCTAADIPYFTLGKVYVVDRIDADGDVWTIDDTGDTMFMYASECKFVNQTNCTCECTCGAK